MTKSHSRCKRFFSLLNHPGWQPVTKWVYGAISPVVKQPVCEPDHLAPSTAQLSNMWIFFLHFPICLCGTHKKNFIYFGTHFLTLNWSNIFKYYVFTHILIKLVFCYERVTFKLVNTGQHLVMSLINCLQTVFLCLQRQ
jgi:hypothetical protein